jgi:hypothetical protein
MSDILLAGGHLVANGITGNAGDERGIVSVSIPVIVPDLPAAFSLSPSTVASAVSISGLTCKSRPFRMQDDGEFEVTFNFEGAPAEFNFEAPEAITYELDGSTSEDPIESHWDFDRLVQIYDGDHFDDLGLQWQGFGRIAKTKGELAGARADNKKNPLFGTTSYYVGGCVWRRTMVSKTFPPSMLRALGKIDSPPGNPPPAEGKQNWLKIRVSARWRGNCWEIAEEWLLSGDAGWNPDVYRQVR